MPFDRGEGDFVKVSLSFLADMTAEFIERAISTQSAKAPTAQGVANFPLDVLEMKWQIEFLQGFSK